MRPWFVVVALAACSHTTETATTPKPVSTCKRAADQIVDVLALQAKDAGRQVGPEQYKQMSDLLVQRCETDHWSAEAQQCATAAKTAEEFGRCENTFTKAQTDSLIQSVGGETKEAKEPEAAAGGGGPATGAAPPATVAPSASPPPPPSPAPSPTNTTRGANKKPPAKASDPCEGGQ